jgi:hypothetical protein
LKVGARSTFREGNIEGSKSRRERENRKKGKVGDFSIWEKRRLKVEVCVGLRLKAQRHGSSGHFYNADLFITDRYFMERAYQEPRRSDTCMI